MMKSSFIYICFVFLLGISYVVGGRGEVCFPFGETVEAPKVESYQGRPGKIGPTGLKGEKGDQGPIGPPGQSSCNSNEIKQLREELRIRDETINRLATSFDALKRNNRVLLCGAGLKNWRIKDEDITASSTYNNVYSTKGARLDTPSTSSNVGGWLGCSACRKPGEWIQVDFKSPVELFGVVTQGRARSPSNEYVTSYKISYGNSTQNMSIIQDSQGNDLIFRGNTDGTSYAITTFPDSFVARYVRLIVETYHLWGTVRLEYLTC